jgi:hypothetical protein
MTHHPDDPATMDREPSAILPPGWDDGIEWAAVSRGEKIPYAERFKWARKILGFQGRLARIAQSILRNKDAGAYDGALDGLAEVYVDLGELIFEIERRLGGAP